MLNAKGLDMTHSDTWETRDAMLGDMTYAEYLRSDHWQWVKRKALKRKTYQKCEYCGATPIELHHASYKWIFTKFELTSVHALCRDHHQEVHDMARRTNLSVRLITYKLRRFYKKAAKRLRQAKRKRQRSEPELEPTEFEG
jgi:hypothetical protein